MKPDKDSFEKYLNQLVRLLQKMMKSMPGEDGFQGALKPDPKNSDQNLNIFLFNFLPMLPLAPEELEEMEEFLDAQLSSEGTSDELTSELNSADKDFLRKNGIRF